MPYILKTSAIRGWDFGTYHWAVLEVEPGVTNVPFIPIRRKLACVKRIVKYWEPEFIGPGSKNPGYIHWKQAKRMVARLNRQEADRLAKQKSVYTKYDLRFVPTNRLRSDEM